MKRLVPVLALFLGASVCSQAAVVTSAIGPTLLGASGSLINFEGVVLGSNAFTSLPFNVSQSSGPGVIATISQANTLGFTGTGGIGNLSSINATTGLNAAVNNQFLTNWSYAPDFTQNSTRLANRIAITFNAGLQGLDFIYSGNDSRNATNRVVFNTCVGGTFNGTTCTGTAGSEGGLFAVQTPISPSLVSLNNRLLLGSTQVAGTVITGIVIEFNGLDNGPGFAVDFMAFDNFNAFVALTGGEVVPPVVPPVVPGPGAIPEPSTYALMGAGLAALAYARRKQ